MKRKKRTYLTDKKLVKELAILMVARANLRSFLESYVKSVKGTPVVDTKKMDERAFTLMNIDRKLHRTLNAYRDDLLALAEAEANKAIRGLDQSGSKGVYPMYFALSLIAEFYDKVPASKVKPGVKALMMEAIDAVAAEFAKLPEAERKKLLANKKASEDYAEILVKRILTQQ